MFYATIHITNLIYNYIVIYLCLQRTEVENIITLSKAFSDINRLKIVTLILREKELCVCEICDTLNLSQPLVSRHLKQLKDANILESYQSGKWIIYTITSKPTPLSKAYFNELQLNFTTLPKLITCTRMTHDHKKS